MTDKEDIYAKWIDGKISDSELEAVEGTEALVELKQITQEVNQWSTPKYDVEEGYDKLNTKLQETPTVDRKPRWPKLIVVIGLIAILVCGVAWYMSNQKEVVKAEPGKHLLYAFQDESQVWINSGSYIEYQSANWSTQRTVELQGEAFFDVRTGAPFIVNTANGSISVLGTQFNVRAWGENLYVECYEGKVQVKVGNQTTILSAKERVNIIAGSMNQKQTTNISEPSWRGGMSRFYDDKLTVVCEELERQYQIKIHLKAADRTFSGNLKHNDLDDALQSICKPLNLTYTISKDKKLVVIE